MSIYENLVMQTQMNYSRYYGMYMAGKSPYKNSNKVIPYKEQIHIFAKQIQNAESFERQGFSVVLEEETMTNESLLATVDQVYENRQKYIDSM